MGVCVMFQTAQKTVAAKEKELGELHTKIRELERKEADLRAEKVVLPCVFFIQAHCFYVMNVKKLSL